MAFILSFAQQDADWLLDAFLDPGMMGGAVDRRESRFGLAEVIQDYARKPLRDWSLGQAFLRVSRLEHGQNGRVPCCCRVRAPRSQGRLVHEARSVMSRLGVSAPSAGAPVPGVSALVAVGLFVASAWLLVHEAGPRLVGIPLLPTTGMTLAIILTRICLKKDAA